jgi:hypothetical protein
MDRTIPILNDGQPRAYRSTWVCRDCGSGEHGDPANQVNVQKSDQVNFGASRGRSQVNVIRSSNSGVDRIALDDHWEGEGFPGLRALRL